MVNVLPDLFTVNTFSTVPVKVLPFRFSVPLMALVGAKLNTDAEEQSFSNWMVTAAVFALAVVKASPIVA